MNVLIVVVLVLLLFGGGGYGYHAGYLPAQSGWYGGGIGLVIVVLALWFFLR